MAAALLLLVPLPETRHTLGTSLAIERTDALQGHAVEQHRRQDVASGDRESHAGVTVLEMPRALAGGATVPHAPRVLAVVRARVAPWWS